MKLYQHFKTITHHKYLVMKGCFSVGLYWQGLLHDLSKYMPSEFRAGVKYYQGDRSPNNAQREIFGYSEAWLHHKGRNKHHYEYWTDYNVHGTGEIIIPVKMPINYIVEMFMDRVAASKVYNKEDYKDSDPINYYMKSKDRMLMHPETRKLLESLLLKLATTGETMAFLYIRNEVLHKKQFL